jgi:hypothetical protein
VAADYGYKGYRIQVTRKRDWIAIIYRPGAVLAEPSFPQATDAEGGENEVVRRAEAWIDADIIALSQKRPPR